LRKEGKFIMPIEAAIALYLIGILIGAIGFGAYVHPKRVRLDNFDIGLFLFMILLWPVILACAIGAGLVIGVLLLLVFKPIQFLMYKGEDWCNLISDWWKERRKAKKEENN
jgi:hypothetical protein